MRLRHGIVARAWPAIKTAAGCPRQDQNCDKVLTRQACGV